MQATSDENRAQYEGWRVVAASGLGAYFTSIFVFTFGVLLKPLADEFTWSRQAISLAFGSMTLAVSLAAPISGHVVDRFGPRWIVGPSLLAAAVSFGSLSILSPHLWHLYVIYVAIGLASSGTSPVVYSRVVASWFDRYRGTAMALVIACIGLGAITHPLLTQTLTRAFGWRTACTGLALVIAVIGVPTVSRFVREPRTLGTPGTPGTPVTPATPGTPGTLGTPGTPGTLGTQFMHALRSRVYWTLIVVVFGSTLSMNGVVVHLSALLSDRGLAASQGVAALSTMGGASLVGRLLTGRLLDRFNGTRVSFALLTMAAAGTVVLAGAHTMWGGLIAAALIGFGTGGEVDVTPYLLSRYFGLRSLSTLYGFTWLAFGLAGVAGPILMGRAFDATGSYNTVLIGFAAVTLAVAVLMLTLPVDKVESAAHVSLL
jgi:MFS family permease